MAIQMVLKYLLNVCTNHLFCIAEDYYANDYPEEEEELSDNYEDEFFFDQSVEIEEFDDEDGFDLDPLDYEENSDSFTDDFDEDGIYCYDEDE